MVGDDSASVSRSSTRGCICIKGNGKGNISQVACTTCAVSLRAHIRITQTVTNFNHLLKTKGC